MAHESSFLSCTCRGMLPGNGNAGPDFVPTDLPGMFSPHPCSLPARAPLNQYKILVLWWRLRSREVGLSWPYPLKEAVLKGVFFVNSLLVCLDHHNKMPYTGWLKQQEIMFSLFWRLKSPDQGAGGVVFSGGLSPCLADGIFLLCLHMAFALCMWGERGGGGTDLSFILFL